MSERDPFDTLRDLIDEPVAPRDAFADGLRSRLMREMSASEHSREEQTPPMDAVFAPRPPVAFPSESVRGIRPMVILELAAVAVIILGLVAALNRGWFQNEPDPATTVPAAALQDDSVATPKSEPERTSTPLPTMVPDQGADMTLEPTAVPPGNLPNTIWAVPISDGEITNFGGMLVDDDTVYRLLATSSFVGVQAVDAASGTLKWEQAHQWAGNLFAVADDMLFFDGGGNTLTAIDAETGAERWRANVTGNPLALDTDDDRVFVLLDSDFVTALDRQTGDQLWVAQGQVPENPTGGSASLPAEFKVAVEDEVVATISTYGVLSGFDIATGTELWALEGYDAAMTSIQSADDLFVVSIGSFEPGRLTVVQGEDVGASESGTAVAVASSSSSSVNAGSMGGTACSELFAEMTPERGTPEAVAVTAGVAISNETGAGSTVLSSIQGIDPVTGVIVWEQQQAAVSAEEIEATGVVSLCAVDAATGELQTLPGTADGVLERSDGVVVGVATGSVVVPIQSADEADIITVLMEIGTVSDGPSGFIAIVADDSGVYGTMADGTLIKIGMRASTAGDSQLQQSDDADSGTPDTDN